MVIFGILKKDPVKYEYYQNAVFNALVEKNKPLTIMAVVGAGRGPIVKEALAAAKRADKTVAIYNNWPSNKNIFKR